MSDGPLVWLTAPDGAVCGEDGCALPVADGDEPEEPAGPPEDPVS